jgi:DNA mismatch repair ATPase MutS
MDEVGRGTTVEDGLAIAFSTVHHLSSVVQCRALFATHFHELADMFGQSPNHPASSSFGGINFYCTSVDETDVNPLPSGFCPRRMYQLTLYLQ